MEKCAVVNFYIQGRSQQFARRVMYHVPRVGEICQFKEDSHQVIRVEWCLDEDATERGVRINIEMSAS